MCLAGVSRRSPAQVLASYGAVALPGLDPHSAAAAMQHHADVHILPVLTTVHTTVHNTAHNSVEDVHGSRGAGMHSALPPVHVSRALASFAHSLVTAHGVSDTFTLVDVSSLLAVHAAWVAAYPRVTVHYAVRDVPDAGSLALLAALGAGFEVETRADGERLAALEGATI